MEQEVEQLKTLVKDLFAKIESLEERVSILEEEGAGKPKGPEPILTCVQCETEYKESENADGHCKYHSKSVKYGEWNCTYKCCNACARDEEEAKKLVGCTKGKHRSKHHSEYTYANYFFHMSHLSYEAKEMWLAMDVVDYITERCECAEVGLTEKGNLFVIVGAGGIWPEAFVEYTPKELKKLKKTSTVAMEKKDPVGWSLKAELHSTNSTLDYITLSIKPASSKTALVKKLSIIFKDDLPRPGDVEVISEAYPPKPAVSYTVPECSYDGPVLEAGPDYSKDRKTDYPTETNDDMFAVQLQQVGGVKADQDMFCRGEKFNNVFDVNIRAVNGSPNIVSITDFWGEYMNHDGEWVKVDKIYVGPKGKDFYDTRDFLIDPAAPNSLIVRMCIYIPEEVGKPGRTWMDRCKAHVSLPQPLHFRVTFEDQEKSTASLRFEQGNPPLDLPTREGREKSWNDNKPLPFYISADNVKGQKRSDAAIFFDDKGVLCFCPSTNQEGMQTIYYVHQSMMDTMAFKAKKAGKSEYELEKMRKEVEDPASTIAIYAVVDLDNEHTYALKVAITTATSSATGYFLLPNEDYTGSTISTDPDEVLVSSDFTVNWSVPRASKSDEIEIYPVHGNKDISSNSNKQAETDGSTKMKAPGLPGEYEVRYYPKCLRGTYAGGRMDVFVAAARFTVDTV